MTKAINNALLQLYSRDRNREHAKNTRLRKKAYVIKLKELAEQLETQKVFDDTEKKSAATNLSQRVCVFVSSVFNLHQI